MTTDAKTHYINIYIAGGDTTVDYDLDGLIKTLKETFMIEKANEGSRLKITSAVGMAKGYGRDVLEVVKRADEAMYKNKMKSKSGR